jgi:hypothetical protein
MSVWAVWNCKNCANVPPDNATVTAIGHGLMTQGSGSLSESLQQVNLTVVNVVRGVACRRVRAAAQFCPVGLPPICVPLAMHPMPLPALCQYPNRRVRETRVVRCGINHHHFCLFDSKSYHRHERQALVRFRETGFTTTLWWALQALHPHDGATIDCDPMALRAFALIPTGFGFTHASILGKRP